MYAISRKVYETWLPTDSHMQLAHTFLSPPAAESAAAPPVQPPLPKPPPAPPAPQPLSADVPQPTCSKKTGEGNGREVSECVIEAVATPP